MLGCQIPEVAREVVEDVIKEVEGMAEKVEYAEEVAECEEVKVEKLALEAEGGDVSRVLELQSSSRVLELQSSSRVLELQSPRRVLELQSPCRRLELQSSSLDTQCILTLATVDLETVTDDILTENFSDQVPRVKPLSHLLASLIVSPCLPYSPNSFPVSF